MLRLRARVPRMSGSIALATSLERRLRVAVSDMTTSMTTMAGIVSHVTASIDEDDRPVSRMTSPMTKVSAFAIDMTTPVTRMTTPKMRMTSPVRETDRVKVRDDRVYLRGRLAHPRWWTHSSAARVRSSAA
jgi:hypothetical protein